MLLRCLLCRLELVLVGRGLRCTRHGVICPVGVSWLSGGCLGNVSVLSPSLDLPCGLRVHAHCPRVKSLSLAVASIVDGVVVFVVSWPSCGGTGMQYVSFIFRGLIPCTVLAAARASTVTRMAQEPPSPLARTCRGAEVRIVGDLSSGFG
jgi:hypothetical protein